MTDITTRPPRPQLFTVLQDNGSVWQVGESIPGSDQVGVTDETGAQHPENFGKQAIKILLMVEAEDGAILAYCAPVPGSDLDGKYASVIERIYPSTIRQTMTIARNDVFKSIVESELADQRCESCSTLNDADAEFCKKCGEPFGEEEEEEPEVQAKPTPTQAAPSPAANGGA
jgi:hypothetical protein